MDTALLIASAINTTGVLVVVGLLKQYVIPGLDATAPWAWPILAAALGPAVLAAEHALGAWLGVPVDLSPIAAVATGASAVAVHQVYKQAKKSGAVTS